MMASVASASKHEIPGATAPEKVKLLLVDDDRDNLLALQAVLDPLNENLLLAGSGMDALRLCLDHDFAAILLDVRMPEMDGFETAELIRSRKRSRETPILFLTAYRSDEQLFRGYDLGAVDFLFKPIVPEVLQSKVSVFVELSRSTQLLRRQAEALARTERKFRAVLEAAPDAMVITAEDGTIQLANSRTDSLFGYSRDLLLGLNIRQVIPQWESPGSEELDREGMPPTEMRLRAVHKNGTAFPVEITRSPFESSEGLLVTTAIRDATEQVEAEERIRRINTELERRVAERTVELTRSNEALRQFAWAASHDLQEPIRMALSYSQWIAKSAAAKLDQSETDMLQVVHENASRMATLLAALRQYIYISETGDQGMAPIDCNAAVQTALRHLERSIAESGAIIECDKLPTIQSIEILLVQLFQNLVGNAIKYRREVAPHIRIRAEQGDDGGWTFSVEDNGIGIEPQYADFIFGVFKRLHGKKYSGTGIGLAICKAAADRLGGRIWLESTPGSGSTFRFSLPGRAA